jgi:hypothetical protein
MNRKIFNKGLALLGGSAVLALLAAWMLVPLAGIPLGAMTDAQGSRVAWGWAIAALGLGLAFFALVVMLHARVGSDAAD